MKKIKNKKMCQDYYACGQIQLLLFHL
jgi:hypothetical protein